MSATAAGWDPGQYEQFRAEREQPFYDLLGLVRPVPGGRVVDLGCGTGALTKVLHERTGAATTVGIDNAPAMLADAERHAGAGLSFALADINSFGPPETAELVFSNAAIQWTDDPDASLTKWAAVVADGGQLAIQTPSNADHPSHLVSAEVARSKEFEADWSDGGPPPDPVTRIRRPEEYAERLNALGFAEQSVRLQVYGHRLPTTTAVVEWVKGTSLVRFKTRLAPERYDAFLQRYTARLLEVLEDRQPYFYAFKRVLLWAAR